MPNLFHQNRVPVFVRALFVLGPDFDGMSCEFFLESFGREEAQVELEGVGDPSNNGDGVLKTEFLKLNQ